MNGMGKMTNDEWIELLSGSPDEVALEELRELLVRGLRYTLSSRVDSNLDALVEDFTQEALLKVLDKIDTFRGESQFTTWAQKIAVRVAFTELRRKRWKNRSLEEMTTSRDGESEIETLLMSDPGPTPEDRTSQKGMMNLVQRLIRDELTDRQRTAILKVMVSGTPMDVAAEELGTNRNALYKLIHDARVRLKERIVKEGLSPQDVLDTF